MPSGNLFDKDSYLLKEAYILFYNYVLLGKTKYFMYFRLYVLCILDFWCVPAFEEAPKLTKNFEYWKRE